MDPLTDTVRGQGGPPLTKSQSRDKWWVLLGLCSLWSASFFCIICNAPLEDTLYQLYDLTSTQFALFSTVSFVAAFVGSCLCPVSLRYLNVYHVLFVSCVSMVIGQSLVIVGLTTLTPNSNSSSTSSSALLIVYAGRVLIGAGYGVHNVLVMAVVQIWFDNSQWLPFAINAVNASFQLAVLVSRWCVLPLYNLTQSLFWSYGVGVIGAVASVIACLLMDRIAHRFDSQDGQQANSSFKLDSDYRSVLSFNVMTWLIIVVIVLQWASEETQFSLWTEPFMYAFGFDEWTADTLLSSVSIYSLTVGQLVAWVMSKYGYVSYYLVSIILLMCLAMMTMLMYDVDTSSINAWIPACTVLAVNAVYCGHCIAAGYTCLFMVCSVEQTAIVNTVVTVLVMGSTAAETMAFGLISDEYGYWFALLLYMCIIIASFAVGMVAFVIDIKEDGPLHKKAQKKEDAYISLQGH